MTWLRATLLAPLLALTASVSPALSAAQPAPAPLTVAFIGDQGLGADSIAVLELIRDRGAELVVHAGDFDYTDDPEAWAAQIDGVLGADFPYLITVGNHDRDRWPDYQAHVNARLARQPQIACEGDLGVNSACRVGGVLFLLSGAGTLGRDHDAYLDDQLQRDGSPWRVCAWHKNRRALQVGGKGNEVPLVNYQVCHRHGAVIATAHEHIYARTRTLSDVGRQTVDAAWPEADRLRVAPGATFVFVSGLGGSSIRGQLRCTPLTFPYGCKGEWASIYTDSQGATYGALFITFHAGGDPRLARGEFVNVEGEVIDAFTVVSEVNPEG